MAQCAAATLIALLAIAAGGTPAQEQPRLDIDGYHRLVDEYLNGDPDNAVAEFQKHAPNTVDEIRTMVRRSWSLDAVRAAAMLETEAGISIGSVGALETRLTLAQAWIDNEHHARRRGEPDDFRPQWYVTTGRKLLALSIAGAADAMLKKATEKYTNDAALFLVYGLALETSAFAADGMPALAAYVDSGFTLAPFSATARSAALVEARGALQRALKLAPKSVEAQVRLANVYLALKDERRAVPLLEQVRAAAPSPSYGYVATLLLADVHARNRRLQPAIDLYLEARAMVPGGQSAYIAHAHALRSEGQVEAAASVIGEMLAWPTHEDDPWMQYPQGFETDAADMKRLRELVRKK